MSTNRPATIYLHDGRAWIADGARVWSLVAWLSAHPGRGAALRLLALESRPPSAARARAPWGVRVRASVLGRLLGRRAPSLPHAAG